MRGKDETGGAGADPGMAAGLRTALAALAVYDAGSGRGALVALDEAAAAAEKSGDPALEASLAAVLGGGAPVPAKRFACEKLAGMGGPKCVPALSALLAQPELTEAARGALQQIPGKEAASALREGVGRLSGPAKVGAIASLGARRDRGSVSLLAKCAGERDRGVRDAALAALGMIADRRAAAVLRRFVRQAPAETRGAAVDAVLMCAQRLRRDGQGHLATTVAAIVDRPGFPAHVREAAAALR